jgi:enoyl-CoA hydratase
MFERMSTAGNQFVMGVMQEVREMVVNAVNFSKPTVCAMNGSAMGGPLAFALLNDFVIAERDVVFSDLHVPHGVAAGDGGVLIWPLTVGIMRARKALLLGESFDAETAERLGLISEVVDTGKSYERALEYVAKLAAMPRDALRHTKHALNEWLRMALPAFDLSWAGEIMTAGAVEPK